MGAARRLADPPPTIETPSARLWRLVSAWRAHNKSNGRGADPDAYVAEGLRLKFEAANALAEAGGVATLPDDSRVFLADSPWSFYTAYPAKANSRQHMAWAGLETEARRLALGGPRELE